jgi:hypothetical protein
MSTKALLEDQGWTHDAFICHSVADDPFAELLQHEMVKCGLKVSICKEFSEKGHTDQLTMVHSLINSPFCMIVISHGLLNQTYAEAIAEAALAFTPEHKAIYPIFYETITDDCHLWTREIYGKLFNIAGFERKYKTDEDFAKAISQNMKAEAETQLRSKKLKLWKPNGGDWKFKRDIGLQVLSELTEDLNKNRASLADGPCATQDIVVRSSGGKALPITSSVSNQIGLEGGTIQFENSDVSIRVPQGTVSFPTTFILETYVDPVHLPSLKLKDEIPLSPAYHLSTTPPHDHFIKPLQLSLPLDVPLEATDHDTGWLLQLKKVMSPASQWHTILELNTKTGEVLSHSSFLHYDQTQGTVHLDQFSRFAWLGKPFRAIRSKLGFNPLRKINYTVFGKQIESHKWCIATHIIHGTRVVYEALVHTLKEKNYIELTHPKSHCIRHRSTVSLCIRCLKPWHVQLGKQTTKLNTNQIWRNSQHSSCYHEVMIEDSSFEATTLDCLVEASSIGEDRDDADSVELVVSAPLQLFKPNIEALASLPERMDSSGNRELMPDNNVFRAILKYGVDQWYSIGLEMGFTGPQIKGCTFDIPSSESKLQAIIQKKICDCGVRETENCLLAACENIPHPVIGAVLQAIKKECSEIENDDDDDEEHDDIAAGDTCTIQYRS